MLSCVAVPAQTTTAPSRATARPSELTVTVGGLEPGPVAHDEATTLAACADLPAGPEHAAPACCALPDAVAAHEAMSGVRVPRHVLRRI